jgi:hypothetical protein
MVSRASLDSRLSALNAQPCGAHRLRDLIQDGAKSSSCLADAAHDLLFDASDDFAGRVVSRKGNFVRKCGVAFVADAGQHWDFLSAYEPGETIIVQPCGVVHGPTATNDHDGIRPIARSQISKCELSGRDDLSRGALALEAAERIDESADAELLQTLYFFPEIAKTCGLLRCNNQDDSEVPGRQSRRLRSNTPSCWSRTRISFLRASRSPREYSESIASISRLSLYCALNTGRARMRSLMPAPIVAPVALSNSGSRREAVLDQIIARTRAIGWPAPPRSATSSYTWPLRTVARAPSALAASLDL